MTGHGAHVQGRWQMDLAQCVPLDDSIQVWRPVAGNRIPPRQCVILMPGGLAQHSSSQLTRVLALRLVALSILNLLSGSSTAPCQGIGLMPGGSFKVPTTASSCNLQLQTYIRPFRELEAS